MANAAALADVRNARRDRWIDVGIAAVAVVLMSGPVLFTDRVFQVDTTNFLWMGSVIRHSMAHGLPPSFFLNTNAYNGSGIFNPLFAFYGGPLFVFFALLITVCGGNLQVAFAVLVVLTIASAYGGAAWIARQCGIRGRLVHLPALALVTAAYYLSNLYGRGDLPELVAISMIPLVVASATHLVRAKSWTVGPIALLMISVILFTGSHNITLLWGVVIGVPLLVAIAWIVRSEPVRFRRLIAVAGVMLVATMVNAWYLLPDVFLSGTTAATKLAPALLDKFTFFDKFGVLFNPGRAVPAQSGSHALFVQAPVWFLLWAVACGVWMFSRWRRVPAALRRTWVVLAIAVIAIVLLITHNSWWTHLPSSLRAVQFAYRMNAYVLLLAAGLVLVCALFVQRETDRGEQPRVARAFLGSLLAVSVISLGLGVWQEWVPRSCPRRTEKLAQCPENRSQGITPTDEVPATWYAGNYYADGTTSVPRLPGGSPFFFAANEVNARGDRLEVTVNPPAGAGLFWTNIMAGPRLAKISGGLERAGRTETGYAVLRRVTPGTGPVKVVIEMTHDPVIVAGRWISLLGLILSALVLLAPALPALRRRRGDRAPVGASA